MTKCDVAIIGAGPYGLSAAAHLQRIKGLDARIFGQPMAFWKTMPAGMCLRSNWTATTIADPVDALTLDAYQLSHGKQLTMPLPLEDFLRYGAWYQRHAVPDVDTREVIRLERTSNAFALRLQDESISARRVIVAAGIGPFARIPVEFKRLPCTAVSHSSAHRDLGIFSRKRVLVIGGGQSSLESAALLHEAGADAEVIVRAPLVNWLGGVLSRTMHKKLGKSTARLLYAPTDVGPAGISQLMARPDLVRRLPRSLQDVLWRRSVRPAGARWLVSRLKDVPLRFGRYVLSASAQNDQIRVTLDDRSERQVDHVLLGTGYQVDISRYGFIDSSLMQSIERVRGYPVLGRAFETSVPDLHILGAPAARSFGPLMQFVSGTTYASRSLLHHIAPRAA